jgi:hypothetical protein
VGDSGNCPHIQREKTGTANSTINIFIEDVFPE